MALERNRVTPHRPLDLITVPAAAGAHLFGGGIAARNGDGYAVVASADASLRVLGRIETETDNRAGANGDQVVLIRHRGSFRWRNSAGTDRIEPNHIGTLCYVVDDETVARTDGGGARPPAGRVVGVESAGVWVDVSGAEEVSAGTSGPVAHELRITIIDSFDNSVQSDTPFRSYTGDFLCVANWGNFRALIRITLPPGRSLIGIYDSGTSITDVWTVDPNNERIYTANFGIGPASTGFLVRTN